MTEEVVSPPSPDDEEAPKKKKLNGPLERPAGKAPSAPQSFARSGVSEADLVWNQVCEWLPGSNDPALPTRSPFDVTIQVRRTWPPHASGLAQPIGQGFSGSAVAGSGTTLPGQALINFITRYVHLPTTDQPATYDLLFFKKGTGALLTSGRLPMPSGPECRAMMAAAEQAERVEASPGLGLPPVPPGPSAAPRAPEGYGAYPSPWQAPPPWGFGYPPQAPPAVDAATLGELSYLRGALSEALSAAKERRDPVIPPAPPGLANPPRLTDDELVERITNRVLQGLRGAGMANPPQVAAPMPAAPSGPGAGLAKMVEQAVGSIFETSLKTFVGEMEKGIKKSIGAGAPPRDEEPGDEPPAQIVPPENPEDGVPWKSYPVGANWSNGQPVKLALDKESGGPSLMGLAMTNPIFAEKLMGIAEGLGQAVQEVVRKVAGAPQGPQVVSHIPPGAIDGTPHVAPMAPMAPMAPPPMPPMPQGPQPQAQPQGWGAPR